ncbi:hypothetical protein IAI10_03760 [Clostridium sp. 19966]|uniref:hypothetical protein n=1 Tax=Clostridium sp. 19966 TaxID=2768166 RepID=UPI0028DD7086|nr:hypothetical protein [Clostridium sp. 19966]MDT8715766.1 hypothetical protein [Clostridium sp. 19966]
MRNKYFSMALFYRERKNILWVMISYLITFSFLLLAFYSDFDYTKQLFAANTNVNFTISNSSEIIPLLYVPTQFFVILSIIMVIVSFFHKEKKYGFMLTEPMSKDAIIITKTVGFIISYTIPIIIYGIVALGILKYNSQIFGSHYSEIVRVLMIRLFSAFALLTFITVVLELFQMLFGHSVAAVFVPNGLFYAFILGLGGFYELLSNRLQFIKDLFRSADNISSNAFDKILVPYFDHYYVIYSLVLLLVSAFIFYIVLLLNRVLKYEQLSKMLMFRFSEVVFKIVVSLVIIIAVPIILAIIVFIILHFVAGISTFNIDDNNDLFQTLLLILNFLWIPMFIFVYRLQTKIINKRRAS